MFNFWSKEAGHSQRDAATLPPTPGATWPTGLVDAGSSQSDAARLAVKRSWDAVDGRSGGDDVCPDMTSRKRTKLCPGNPDPDVTSTRDDLVPPATSRDRLERAREVISHQLGLEVLVKHNELRLINQELAKCQIALEQLRRCHLIPYPQHCPTPDQMLEISGGKGPAAITRFGESVPRWAPPFGVTNGPYARHYAKWLIPDPSFDGEQSEWHLNPELAASRLEGRTTRNSFTETGPPSKSRPVRGNAGQRLQALSSGYPQPKDKAGPCVLKRSDGQTVKLVCLDCNRENFSSTQGFINHCRIAHKRDFKSHEEAAVHSGQPIEGNSEAGRAAAVVGGDDKPQVSSNPTLGATCVHPLARPDMSDQDAYAALRSRIAEALELYHQGKLPGVGAIPSTGAALPRASAKPVMGSSVAAPEAPYLSQLMLSRNFNGNLCEVVADAKTKDAMEDVSMDDESDDDATPANAVDEPIHAAPMRTPIVKRVLAQSGKQTAASTDSAMRPSSGGSSSSSVNSTHSDNNSRITPISLASTTASSVDSMSKGALSDEDEDTIVANLSPNTLASNNAPSLVSDDGEYDESDDACSMISGGDDADAESVSDVAEISLDDDHDARPLRRDSNGVSGTVRLRKDDTKKQHVTILGPVKNKAKSKRSRRT
ncbi:hypothetical protein AAL_01292 [Moelleriella libera RCEF 2490]|uniref:AHC1-like C2H2 zinc-finger domain-containing protein n=1 Tax=Moelleriella libera RCEF 2490 TaxID=1081109 RepID=A0A166VMN4_9HYPO|nr:hypothetical protein AAL_01292 [Moelleriella libera RCEF 2490]